MEAIATIIVNILGFISSLISISDTFDEAQAKKLTDIETFFIRFNKTIKNIQKYYGELRETDGSLNVEKLKTYNDEVDELKKMFEEDFKYVTDYLSELEKLTNKADINRAEIEELEKINEELYDIALKTNDRAAWTKYENNITEIARRGKNVINLSDISDRSGELVANINKLSSSSFDEMFADILRNAKAQANINLANTTNFDINTKSDTESVDNTKQIDNTNKNIPEIIPLLKDISDEMGLINNYVSQTTESTKFLTEQAKKYNEEIEKREWERKANAVADEVIGIYKDFYQTKKKLELDAIDEQLKREEKRHNKVIDNLDEELDKYEETINAKLQMLDREEDEESFEKQLSGLQGERAQLQSSLNLLSLDDSMEAKFRREELAKQIAEKEEEIEELKSQRTKEIRKQNLQDQLDAYRKDVEEKKKAENNKYEAVQDSLISQREYWNNYYDEQINNEIKFAEIRRQIIQGNLADIKADLEQFKNEINSNKIEIGINKANGTIENIDIVQGKMEETQNSKPGNTNNSSAASSKSWHADWIDEKYLSDQQKEDKAYAISLYGKDELRKSLLNRVANPEPGKTQQDILNYAKKIGIILYHHGGTVGGRSFNPQTEEIAKLLKGEEIFSKQQLLRVPNILGNIMKYSLPEMQRLSNPNHTVLNVSMNIDKLTGDKEGAQILLAAFVNGLKAKGVTI